MLAEAFTEYETNAFCSGCGQHKSKAWNEDTAGSWERKHVTCYACQASAQNTTPLEPGQLGYMSLNEKDYQQSVKRREFLEGNPDFNLDQL